MYLSMLYVPELACAHFLYLDYMPAGNGEDSVCTCARGQLQHSEPHASQLSALTTTISQGQCVVTSFVGSCNIKFHVQCML